MIFTSSVFNDKEEIPMKFTCDGGDMNPEFQIQNIPSGAHSLALIMDDPDAPGSTPFVHWVVWNIDPNTTFIKEESKPAGSCEGKNSSGGRGYLGPCPPTGDKPHRYVFALHALDVLLDIPETTDSVGLKKAMEGHILESAYLEGFYQRTT
jgi:Raf kinase inhibitor-like YbhB/YbcL family protein